MADLTREELPSAIGQALIAKNNVYDGEADVLMPVIDAYVAAERERIAKAIDQMPLTYASGNDRYPGDMRVAARELALQGGAS